MTSSTITSVNDNERMDRPTHPRADEPQRRRAFTASEKFAHLHAYEQAFMTLKYGPEFPERFGTLSEASNSWAPSPTGTTTKHRHTGIGLHTPPMCTSGWPSTKPLTDARARYPHRFGTTHAPKILDLPHTVWMSTVT